MFDTRVTQRLLVSIGDSSSEEARLIGRRMVAVAELLAWRTAEAESEDPDCGYMIITGLQRTSAEVAAAMKLSARGAGILVTHAEALDTRLPKVRALLIDGRIDWRTVQIILSRTDLVTDSTTIAALDTKLAQQITRWRTWSRRNVINEVDSLIRLLDPDAAKERERAEDRRHITVSAQPDGTAKIEGVVAAQTGVAIDTRLDQLANSVCPTDPRTHDQRRADASQAMANGTPLACLCTTCQPVEPASARGRPASTPSVVINVITDQATLLGGANRPGYLTGFGVIDADQVRALARGASVRTLLEPTPTPEELLRYQPSAALDRYVRLRDITCRFPGCDRPAHRTDLDHTIAFNHTNPAAGGPTSPSNLKCLCRQHHRLKTFHHGWRDQQLPDGRVIWTSPTGHTYTTHPGIDDLFTAEQPSACTQPPPRRRNPQRDTQTRINRRRRRNHTLTPVNQARRRLERARKQEIEYRRDRNRHRTMYAMFKGNQPSTSPYMRYINEPHEPEELPPDWQPPPEPPPPGRDDPPPF